MITERFIYQAVHISYRQEVAGCYQEKSTKKMINMNAKINPDYNHHRCMECAEVLDHDGNIILCTSCQSNASQKEERVLACNLCNEELTSWEVEHGQVHTLEGEDGDLDLYEHHDCRERYMREVNPELYEVLYEDG